MLKVGITGGIGSGKTTVCRIFETLDIPVFHADEESKRVLASDKKVIATIKKYFGKNIYTGSSLNRKKLAAIVFNDPEKLSVLNSITHPAVFRAFDEWVKMQKRAPYVIKEAAIIFEAGAEKQLDYVIAVTAPAKTRLERIVKRDRVTVDEVKSRVKNQWSQEKIISKADFVIKNSGNEFLIPQVLKIHRKLLGS